MKLTYLTAAALIGALSASSAGGFAHEVSSGFEAAAGQPSASGLAMGKFLIASRGLLDPNFAQTVVLLAGYDANGAMGVIVNRPTEVELSKALPDVGELRERHDVLYSGGPVSPHRVFLLLRSKTPPKDSVRLFGDVYMTSSLAILRETLAAKGRKSDFHAYSGYAGWAPGQLDAEVARGDWHIYDADDASVFDKPGADVWPDMIRRVEGVWAGLKGQVMARSTERERRPPVARAGCREPQS